jgi:enoyl-CoA hydratase/carnithine racemase
VPKPSSPPSTGPPPVRIAALACDVRYMAEDVLVLAFSNIGLVPDAGGTLLLPLIGYSRAFELAATARRVEAAGRSSWVS